MSGFEICDVLKINDKDYSITFSLYFSVEWFEPRLNISKLAWDSHSQELLPGEPIEKIRSVQKNVISVSF